ncbi:hypothetical protein R70723_18310 [Paenibacillus sp. FSL R7-0273]|uniref:hypothetical protein n=1 Tax=Paenibacillus sp. FSL R7-0273 TaxID=1536772 RepID=UPI0004F5AEB0|nr:hypothetical protein [Paenibacillus sp. FSL R7-0273]AIQ47626.1 hypothetical protein R70723_18310 [Paenibacillus sp. FSL R7-0273]OMF95818.1 hypothetical protein BK144_04310 [Paenibacillus sp. FSL R7-0273]
MAFDFRVFGHEMTPFPDRIIDTGDASAYVVERIVKFDAPVKRCWAAISSFNIDFPLETDEQGNRIINDIQQIGVSLSAPVPIPEDPKFVKLLNFFKVVSPKMIEKGIQPKGSMSFIVFAETEDRQ